MVIFVFYILWWQTTTKTQGDDDDDDANQICFEVCKTRTTTGDDDDDDWLRMTTRDCSLAHKGRVSRCLKVGEIKVYFNYV